MVKWILGVAATLAVFAITTVTAKAFGNAERLGVVETKQVFFKEQLNRIERKLDKLIERVP
jgi:hypothetical protein